MLGECGVFVFAPNIAGLTAVLRKIQHCCPHNAGFSNRNLLEEISKSLLLPVGGGHGYKMHPKDADRTGQTV